MKFRRQSPQAALLLCLMLAVQLLGGCGAASPGGASSADSPVSSQESGEQAPEPVPADGRDTARPEEPALPDIFPLDFTFSSGAGAWRTVVTLNRDGTFQGSYSDSEMGESGEGYPNGSVYVCEFQGRFDPIRAVDANTYSLTLAELSSAEDEGETWIADGIRYVASIPYGMETGTDFLLCMPETPLETLSEEFLSWWPGRYESGGGQTTLGCCGLCSLEAGYGFFTC